MFTLSLPWWEFVVRAVLTYTALLFFVRLSGKRTIGQFTPFDLLVVMLLSESVSSGLSGGDQSVFGGLITAGTLIALNAVAAWTASRSPTVDSLLEGVPVLLGRDGQLFDEVLRRHRVSEADMQKALREADCKQEEMASAVLEVDGRISVATRK